MTGDVGLPVGAPDAAGMYVNPAVIPGLMLALSPGDRSRARRSPVGNT